MMSSLILATLLSASTPVASAGGPATSPLRDPFVPVLQPIVSGPCAESGPRSLRLIELKLTGLLQTQRGPVATFGDGPKGRSAHLMVGDELCDYMVEAIQPDEGAVVLRRLNWTSRLRPAPTTIRRMGEDGGRPGVTPVP